MEEHLKNLPHDKCTIDTSEIVKNDYDDYECCDDNACVNNDDDDDDNDENHNSGNY